MMLTLLFVHMLLTMFIIFYSKITHISQQSLDLSQSPYVALDKVIESMLTHQESVICV